MADRRQAPPVPPGQQEVAAPPVEPPPTATPGGPSAARLVFRFAVGGSSLFGEWLASALRAIEELPPPADAPTEVVRPGGRAVLVGAVSSAMRWHPPVAPLEAAARRTGRAARRGLGLVANLPGAGAVRRRYRHARGRVAAHLEAWADEGAREELAGRRLARRATPSFFELAVSRLADSPELKVVIEEQSQGIAASSVAELRDRSESADGAVERVMRRVLGRNGHARKRAPR
jgi:hypothetical protein